MLKEGELIDTGRFVERPAYLFDAGAWPQHDMAVAGGRGGTSFVSDATGDYALRAYYRGGLAARLLGDRYWYTGEVRVRSFAEWHLLQRMRAEGLPVPLAAAARYERRGVWYRAWLLTERIADSRTLNECLVQAPLPEGAWRSLGKTIRRFHRGGYCHPDLNVHNVLLDANLDWHLIDFDRGSQRAPGAWCASNIERLRRSLDKERVRHQAIHWQASDWAEFGAAYADS